MLKLFALAFVGALPGLCLAFFFGRFGLAWAFVGAVLASCFAIPGVTLNRVGRLFVSMMVERNTGIDLGVTSSEAELDELECDFNRQVKFWFEARDVIDRRGRYVLVGMLAGCVVVGILLVHDFVVCEDPAKKILAGKGDTANVFGAGLLGLVMIPPVLGGVVALALAPAYGRPTMFFSILPVLAVTAMLIGGAEKPYFPLFFLVGACWLGLGIGLANVENVSGEHES